jgi:hypothetical protein
MNQREKIIEALLNYEGDEFIVTDNLVGFIRGLDLPETDTDADKFVEFWYGDGEDE